MSAVPVMSALVQGRLFPATVAALYVQTDGCYFGLPDVDPWDEPRDARTYDGPLPVVAHPPCARWSRYWFGGPSAKERRVKGDDGGCFAAALAAVRKWGGVLEHPEASAAWSTFGIVRPPRTGGWVACACGGWTCCVEQGHYGHLARKATWLYVFGAMPPELCWGPSATRVRLEQGFHTREERLAKKANGVHHKRMPGALIASTPIAFRDLLLSIAASVHLEARP